MGNPLAIRNDLVRQARRYSLTLYALLNCAADETGKGLPDAGELEQLALGAEALLEVIDEMLGRPQFRAGDSSRHRPEATRG